MASESTPTLTQALALCHLVCDVGAQVGKYSFGVSEDDCVHVSVLEIQVVSALDAHRQARANDPGEACKADEPVATA